MASTESKAVLRMSLALVVIVPLLACSTGSTTPRKAEPALERLKIPSSGIDLAATLCLPGGEPPFPAAVVVHGSGKTLGSNLLRFCDALNLHGLAVLVYDKRGVGDSGGIYRGVSVANSAQQLGELSDDAAAAVDVLRKRDDIDPARIGFIGPSQAGWIIPLAASKRPDVAFLILLSGPSISVGEEMYYSGLTGDTNPNARSLSDEEYEARRVREFEGPAGFNPLPVIEKLKMPSLWLFGEKDESIPAPRCARLLAGAAAKGELPITVRIYPNGDHSLSDVATGQRVPYWKDIYNWLGERGMVRASASR